MNRPINPFCLPESPTELLCPWLNSSHSELYVDVDGTAWAFEKFVDGMGDLATVRKYGQLVLVTGDSGCGKSALVNRCAHWARERLHALGHRGMIVDLTRVLNGLPRMPVEERMRVACDVLFAMLQREGALRHDALESLRPDRDNPRRFYLSVRDALVDDRTLLILLPSADDLADEVIRYAGMAQDRVLFLVESSLLGEEELDNIRHAQRNWIRPIMLCVGALEPGDVRTFIAERLRRHSDRGIYPRMTEETMDSVARLLQSVAQLQRALSGTYDRVLRSGRRYDDHSFVTADDVREEIRSWLGGGP